MAKFCHFLHFSRIQNGIQISTVSLIICLFIIIHSSYISLYPTLFLRIYIHTNLINHSLNNDTLIKLTINVKFNSISIIVLIYLEMYNIKISQPNPFIVLFILCTFSSFSSIIQKLPECALV